MWFPKIVYMDEPIEQTFVMIDNGAVSTLYIPTMFYPDRNEIHILRHHPNKFKALLHDIVHWLLCLLPRGNYEDKYDDPVYKLNVWYDHCWTRFFEVPFREHLKS